jgi:GTP-binding protein
MKITSARYVKSIIGTDEILSDGKFQVAFIGRSNVGKSTLINSLVGMKNLARSSSNPGRTTKLDVFLVNNSFYFVDLPGYGYAKGGMEKREQLAKMIRWYLLDFEVLNRLVILIIDAVVGITPFDLFVLNGLIEKHIKFILVVNKVDKLKMGQKERVLNQIMNDYKNVEIIACSVEKNEGIGELRNKIFANSNYNFPKM